MDTAQRYVGKIIDRRYQIVRIIGIGGIPHFRVSASVVVQ